jgi:hypothetical protein
LWRMVRYGLTFIFNCGLWNVMAWLPVLLVVYGMLSVGLSFNFGVRHIMGWSLPLLVVSAYSFILRVGVEENEYKLCSQLSHQLYRQLFSDDKMLIAFVWLAQMYVCPQTVVSYRSAWHHDHTSNR